MSSASPPGSSLSRTSWRRSSARSAARVETSRRVSRRARQSGRLIIDGSTLLVDLSNELNVDLTDVDANTVAGLLLHHMRRFPQRGESIDASGFRFTVVAMEQRRIARLAVEPIGS